MHKYFGLFTLPFLLMYAGMVSSGQGQGERMILNLKGTGTMYVNTVPDIDGDGNDDEAYCFDVELINMRNQKVIGTATDCLANITPVGDGVAVVGTTYFHLPQGTLISRGLTTAQPVVHLTTTTSGQPVTHITGASSTENAILGGTNGFEQSTGTVRLSGMVDMSGFMGNPGDPVSFDCIFVINLN